MNRAVRSFSFSEAESLKKKILRWAQQFEEVVWLDSNSYDWEHGRYEAILAVDALTALRSDTQNAFDQLEEYQNTTDDWIFGYLSYDLKNDVEDLESRNFDGLNFPALYFFQPKRVFLFSKEEVSLHYLPMVEDEMQDDWKDIHEVSEVEPTVVKEAAPKIKLRTSKDSYYDKLHQMLHHIERGDIYEANFCQEFYAEDVSIDPLHTFLHLNEISKPPFASFLKLEHYCALCASPERYIRKIGNTVLSQPIKGTAKRSTDKDEDASLRQALQNDSKERSENIMITDLVRNDLSRFASKGSVIVKELCVPYTFQQVHQLISTIQCEIEETITPISILKHTFPMGSMTGAPKVSAMKIIEQLEDTKRGLYSGAIGYIDPNGDFDFNVVIRSILYNSEKKYVSFSVGGAITAASVAENEYEECLLKAKAMREALEVAAIG
ncbi:anthranilate synthase component I family protein [Luteirhabdus pelagi]|uniref:anthranilate synthase component I family protein n=1 Tax=Luteirhabdus pelagi TaxID=2792783 RepID=UPI00193A82A2|nr:anthranilate synthase component I family protein [Luteirhabdus pelagi]